MKLIDFGSCSDDPCDYYDYVTKKYKYLGYIDQELDFLKKYFLLKPRAHCDLKSITSQPQDNLQENKLLFFLLIFLGQNEVQSILSEKGLSINILIYLTQKYLGKVNEVNEHFKFESFDVLQRGQWNKISEIKYSIHNQSVEYQIISAFAFKNNLNNVFNEQLIQKDNFYEKISKIIILIENFEIVSIYDSFSQEELCFIEQEIIQKYQVITEELNIFFIQLTCILYCHSQQNHYISIILLNILERAFNSQNLNIFQKKIFTHIYLQDEDSKLCQIFLEYKQMCIDLTAVLEYDSILFYNYRVKKLEYKETLPININEVISQQNTSRKQIQS
ncbi:hypothetical protein ABPG72_006654 [Tetrahymena utriculariae]